MSMARRGFVRTVGLGAAGMLSTPFIIGRGSEAAAVESGPAQVPYDDGIIRISSNENARGPGRHVLAAIQDGTTPRVGRYPADQVKELVATIADRNGVEEKNVIVGTGSRSIIEAATRAFCTRSKPLVAAVPTWEAPQQTAEMIGASIKTIPVDASLRLDPGAMADAARGAGLVFFCNPNNPTGTAHPGSTVEDFVRRVKRTSPETYVLIDEAYIDYTFDPAVKTVAPLALEYPGVFITRTFSKAHGMAGLRVGYAIGREETLAPITNTGGLGSMNTLSAAAAMASIKNAGHIAEDRRENARVRELTRKAFREVGYEVPDTHTNFVFVNLGFPASKFRDACLEQKVQVGRDFPPMEKTHCRISLGTMEEMQTATRVFKQVLTDFAAQTR